MSETEETIPPVEVPLEALSPELLNAVIESFVLHEGTDYGAVEASLATKIRQVQTQIEKGDVKIVFDNATESVTLMNKNEFLRALKNSHSDPT